MYVSMQIMHIHTLLHFFFHFTNAFSKGRNSLFLQLEIINGFRTIASSSLKPWSCFLLVGLDIISCAIRTKKNLDENYLQRVFLLKIIIFWVRYQSLEHTSFCFLFNCHLFTFNEKYSSAVITSKRWKILNKNYPHTQSSKLKEIHP